MIKTMYVIARSASKRPTLQHYIDPRNTAQTLCGNDITPWSRAYQNEPIKEILCQRCKRILELI